MSDYSQSTYGGPSRHITRTGQWQPLPFIHAGFAIHPYRPSAPQGPDAPSPSGGTGDHGIASGRGRSNPYEIPLEVGDQFFAFEEYRFGPDEQGTGEVWYRGYVVQAVSLDSLAPTSPTTRDAAIPCPEPSILIGIFPASCVHVRPDSSVDDGSLALAYETAARKALGHTASGPSWADEMIAVTEEDEEGEERNSLDEADQGGSTPAVIHIPSGLSRQGPTAGKSRRPKSLVLDHVPEKDPPPLPRLTAGDSTVAGQTAPLVDEIACAIREWYTRLPTYLANRDYRLFNTVIQHIDALFLGRRQLLSQTLSADELVKVKRECVSRLVKCNVAQGLEVIVRSMEDGSVMVVERDRAYGGASWVRGIACYAYQIQLAYIDLIPLDTLLGNTALVPSAIPKSIIGATSSPAGPESRFHLLLDVHAFIANPCRQGETAELFFSLYNHAESRFITEEFCLVLNHLGSPARDAELRLGRLCTLFTDLKQEDLAVYLVCRIVRNGAFKMRTALDSATPGEALQRHGRYADMGPMSTASLATDDSFSVTSGFGGHRAATFETVTTSSIDGRPTFRRPLGCAVIALPPLTRLLSETAEVSIPIYVPKDEAAFATLHEEIIENRMKVLVSPRVEALVVSLKAFQGPRAQVVNHHPDVPLSGRLGFPDVAEDYRNDLYVKLWSGHFFPSPMAAGGSIRARKNATPTNHGNVQVTLEVRRQDGTIIPDAIFYGGSGEPAVAHYHSLVFQHTNPTFGEMLRISLPVRADDCHLFLAFRSRGKDRSGGYELEKPFAFAYLPLIQDSACIKDGSHDLVLYRMEKNLQPSPHMYFQMPASADSDPSANNMVPLRDRLTLRTYLCSSVHTQDDTLRSLFRWQELTDAEVASTLRLLAFVDDEEMSKFVTRVLDALFGVLVSNLGDELGDMVFNSLTTVLSMNTDRRFPGFSSVLDTYITRHFNHPASSFHLLRSMKSVMSRPETTDYRAFLKVWHMFFRFIIRSRELDRARGIGLDATSKHIEADFQRQTKGILSDINVLMESGDKTLIGTQTLVVQHYADILPDLTQVFPPQEIAQMVIAFTDTLVNAKGNMAVYKLLLILEVVKILLDSGEARAILVPAIMRWVKPHLGRYGGSQDPADGEKVKWMECNRLAVTVVAWTVDKLQECLSMDGVLEDPTLRLQEEDNVEYCLGMVPSLLDSYAELCSMNTRKLLDRHRATSATIYKPTPEVFPATAPFALMSELPSPLETQSAEGLPVSKTFICGAVETAVVVFTLILTTPRHAVVRWLVEMFDIEGAETVSKTLHATCSFCTSIVRNESYPAQWLTLNLTSLGSILRLLDPVADILERYFIPPVPEAEKFNKPLWTDLLNLLCEFCGNSQLGLEDMTQQRRRAQWLIAGDLREEGAALLLRLWNALGWEDTKDALKYGGFQYQTQFTSMAGSILGLCLSNHDGLCEVAVEILSSIIYAEYVLNGRFGGIHTEIFIKLDDLFSTKTPASLISDPASKAYFATRLRGVFERSPPVDTQFQEQVGIFMDEIELFIDLLLALRDVPEGVAWRDERSLALHRLMLFARRIGRMDLYTRYAQQLRSISLEAKDHLAAGYALKLQAEVYEWRVDGGFVEEVEVGLPLQNQFQRKEALLCHAMDQFVEAEAYEAALEVCREITRQHELLTYDAARLAELLVHQAKLWEKIASSSRPKAEYFRVAYFGDLDNKGKDYVVRGRPRERYHDFCEAIQLKHPSAMIHRSKIPPPESIRHGDEPVIWVTSVTPEPDLTKSIFMDGVAENIQAYWRCNEVKRFGSSRPYSKGQDDAVLTWTEKTILTTAETLPGVLSRSEVVEIAYEQISPIANALLEVRKASRSLLALRGDDVKLLGNAINAAVDSPNGGVELYRSTFLDSDYLTKHPEEGKQVDELRSAITDYAKVISKALAVHQVACRDIAFHEALRSHFVRAFPDEIDTLRKTYDQAILDAPLPPVPTVQAHLTSVPLSTRGLAYTLPLGPLASPSTASPLPSEPRGPASVPVTALSTPRQSLASGQESGQESRVSTMTPPIILERPSFSTRALSLVGSISGNQRSRGSVSMSHEVEAQTSGRGEAGGRTEARGQEGPMGSRASEKGGSMGVKGLKRLSSLMRR